MNKEDPPIDVHYKSLNELKDSKTPSDNKVLNKTNQSSNVRQILDLKIDTQSKISQKFSKNNHESLPVSPQEVFPFAINSLSANSSVFKNLPPEDDAIRFSSFLEETNKNRAQYKKKFLITIVITSIFLGIIIIERILNQTLVKKETTLLIDFQRNQSIGITIEGPMNYFYYLMGVIGEFYVGFLIQTHIFITIYVAVDAFVALKTLFLQFLGCYIISIISMFYASPRPFWVDSKIRTYFCECTFATPGEFQFQALFLVFYLFKCFKDLENEVVLLESDRDSFESSTMTMLDNGKRKKALRMLVVVSVMFLVLIFFFRYAEGLAYLHIYIVGMVYFCAIFGVVLFWDKYLSTLIKQTTIMKNYARRNIFFWLIFLILAEAIGILVKIYFDTSLISLKWIENHLRCQQNNYHQVDNIQYDSILGPFPTLQETTIIFGLVGAIFGANKSFQSIHSLNWFKGPLKFKLIRALVANVCVLPSWILIINQQDIINKQRFGILGGFDNYMINAVHFFVLYYTLFGILPTLVFNKLKCLRVEFKVPEFIPQKII